jgi:hypothetical protein
MLGACVECASGNFGDAGLGSSLVEDSVRDAYYLVQSMIEVGKENETLMLLALFGRARSVSE